VLCIRRTLAEGPLSGLVSGLGAATADSFYGLTAALGFTLLADALIDAQDLLGLVGGGFLLFIGVRTLLSRPAGDHEAAQVERRGRGLLGAYLSTLILTLTNPLTILFFAAVIAGTDLAGDGSAALLVVAGVFLGSAAWWLLLTSGVTLLWRRLPDHGRVRLLLWANRLSGALIIAFALGLLLT
jgi:threonine/homoserine/homoserine lactone efflux protein